jgi:hypothetical protein
MPEVPQLPRHDRPLTPSACDTTSFDLRLPVGAQPLMVLPIASRNLGSSPFGALPVALAFL